MTLKTTAFLAFAVAFVRAEVNRYASDDIEILSITDNDGYYGRHYSSSPVAHKIMGDMMFTEETWAIWNSKARGIVGDSWYRWPKDTLGNVIVPYTLSTNLTVSTANILSAMEQWSSKTCVKFYEKSNPALPAGTGADWVAIINPGSNGGCSSYVGRIHWGAQALNLADGCNSANLIAHEIGHALGFGHENQRSDRDDYLVSFDGNIIPGFADNFYKENLNNYGVPYNYLSTMHYFWNAFSIASDKPTIMPKDPSLKYLLTKNNPVSHYDALAANIAFGCLDTWKATCGATAPVCKNYGYLGPACTCVCPEGTSGVDCGTKTAISLPYYPPPACGGKITAAGAYSVPGMGGARAAGLDCTWYVEAPICQTAQVTISSFNAYKDATQGCAYESLSLSTKNVYGSYEVGPLCGTSAVIPDGTKYTGSSSILMGFRSWVNYNSGAGGFKFQVDFLPNSTCVVPVTTTTVGPTTLAPATATTTKPTTTLPTTTNPTTTRPTTTPAAITTTKPATTLPTTTNPTTTRPTTTPPAITTTKPATALPTTTNPTTTRPTTTPPAITTTKPATTTLKPLNTTTMPPPTTTLRPATTTIRIATTTVPSSPTACVVSRINGTNDYLWVSPNYPGLAPANSRCTLFATTSLTGFNFIFSDFQVPAIDTLCTNAYAVFLPTFPVQKLCTSKTGITVTVPSKFVLAQYQSDPLKATAGFKIILRSY